MGKLEEARVRRGPSLSAAAMERRPARMADELKCMFAGWLVVKQKQEFSMKVQKNDFLFDERMEMSCLLGLEHGSEGRKNVTT